VQLSFVAVAGLMWLSPAWFGGRSGLPGWQGLVAKSRGWFLRGLWAFWWTARHLTLVSATIWLLTLPLVMARFHLFTPAALLLNTVVWIPMTVALGAGLGVLVFGWLLPPVAALFARCCDGALWLLEGCVNQAHGVPGSHFWVPGPADWWLAGFYAGLAVLALGASIGLPRRWSVAILAGWIAVGFAWPTAREEGPRLDCTFLSVGHGAAVVLELPSGQTVLYDAGQFSSPRSGARTIAAFLWSRGITRVDTVILSHPDLDHYNALPELLDRLGVREIRVPAGMFDQESWALAALLQAVQRSGTPIREISQGARVDAGADCRIDVLHPPQGGTVGADNAGSVTLAVDYYGRRILLPGDLEGSGLSELIAQSPWDCDVLLAPHHGSRGSNPPGLAAWCTPEVVVVSGSDEQDLEETVSAYRAAGASVFHTGRVGAVHVGIEKGRIAVAGFLEAKD
jgi:competence protein ComEC